MAGQPVLQSASQWQAALYKNECFRSLRLCHVLYVEHCTVVGSARSFSAHFHIKEHPGWPLLAPTPPHPPQSQSEVSATPAPLPSLSLARQEKGSSPDTSLPIITHLKALGQPPRTSPATAAAAAVAVSAGRVDREEGADLSTSLAFCRCHNPHSLFLPPRSL